MKKALVLAPMLALSLTAFAQVSPSAVQRTPAAVTPESLVTAFITIRDNAPKQVQRLGRFHQLARYCGLTEAQLQGVTAHFKALSAMGDSGHQETLTQAFNQGRSSAPRLSVKDCGSQRQFMLMSSEMNAKQASALQGLSSQALAVGGQPLELPLNNPISTPPGANPAPAVVRVPATGSPGK